MGTDAAGCVCAECRRVQKTVCIDENTHTDTPSSVFCMHAKGLIDVFSRFKENKITGTYSSGEGGVMGYTRVRGMPSSRGCATSMV